MDIQEQNKINMLKEAFDNPKEGMNALAKAIEDRAKAFIENSNMARKFLMVDELPEGRIASYEVANRTKIVTLISNEMLGEANRAEVKVFESQDNERVIVWPFHNDTELEIDFSGGDKYALIRFYKSVDNVIDFYRNSETNIFRDLIETGVKEGIVADASKFVFPEGKSPKVNNEIELKIHSLFACVEKSGLPACRVLMNRKTFFDIKPYIKDILDTSEYLFSKLLGLYGHIWTSDVYCNESIKEGEIYAMPEPSELGILPICQDLIVLPACGDKDVDYEEVRTSRKCKFVTLNEIGMAILYPHKMAKITL